MTCSKPTSAAGPLVNRSLYRACNSLLMIFISVLVQCVGTSAQAQTPWDPPAASPTRQLAAISSDLARRIYRSQETEFTCWAACNRMLLAAKGIESSESDQIQRMRAFMPDGGKNGAGPTYRNVSKALAGSYGDRIVRVWYLDRREPPIDPEMNKKFVEMIQRGTPVMVATPAHGMVAIAVRFAVLSNGHYEISDIKVNDPNLPVPGGRWLSPAEVSDLFGFMAIETLETRRAVSDPEPDPAEDAEEIALAGRWEGRLAQVGLKIVFKIRKVGGDYKVTTDSPDQLAYGIESTISVTGNDVKIDIETPAPASFVGTLNGNVILGVFSQAGQRWPLRLNPKQ